MPNNLEKLKGPLIKYFTKRLFDLLVKNFSFFAMGPMPVIANFFIKKVVIAIAEEGILSLKIFKINAEVDLQIEKLDNIAKKLDSKKLTPQQRQVINAQFDNSIIDLIRIS